MYTLTDLNTAITTLLHATTGLTTIAFYAGYSPEDGVQPYCNMNVLRDNVNGVYGKQAIDQLTMQFAVFTNDLATGSQMASLIASTLSQKITVSGVAGCYGIRRPGLRYDRIPDRANQNLVFRNICVVDFQISNAL